MSRPRQTAQSREAAAKDAFRLEIKLQRVRFGFTQADLAEHEDMDRTVLSRCLAEPDKLTLGRLRKIIQALHLDPLMILALLGYEPRVIQNINKEN